MIPITPMGQNNRSMALLLYCIRYPVKPFLTQPNTFLLVSSETRLKPTARPTNNPFPALRAFRAPTFPQRRNAGRIGAGSGRLTSPVDSHRQFASKDKPRVGCSFLPARAVSLFLAALVALCACSSAPAQSSVGRQQSQTKAPPDDSGASTSADNELQAGTELTRQGHFPEAIPHLLAAQGRVSNEFAADFNLALCYTATNQHDKAIAILTKLTASAHPSARRLQSASPGLCRKWPARASVSSSPTGRQPQPRR